MKKLFLAFACLAIVALISCGGSEEHGTKAPEGMMALDLNSSGMPMEIIVPDTSSSQLIVSENMQGGIDVKIGKAFQITIVEGEGNMELKKSDVTSDAVRKFVKYVVEDQNAIVWQWQIEGMEPEFHFYAIAKVGNKTYEVRDVEGEVFTEKSAMQMLEAAKSMKVKELKKEDA